MKNPPTASRPSRRKSAKKPARTKAVAPAFTYAATANQYARDVTAGRILACRWVKLACSRHLNDLSAARQSSYTYRFDESKANRVCDFIEGLPHVKGHWAAQREEIRLQPWQCFILACLFGWVKRGDGLRRFRIAYICVPRKNGKSILAGGIGDYMFAADGEFGSEVYSGATTEKQAWEVFRPAQQMVERTPDLAEAFGITVAAKSMFIEANGSRFEPIIGKPGDGSSPHCAIIDEYHEHDSDSLLDTMRTGMGARKQPLLLAITTAGDNLAGPCRAMQEDAEHVLAGSVQRDELFSIIYTVDAEVDWTSDGALRMANPNYDVSVFGEFLRSEQKNAIADARKQGVFKTKHLNLWVGAKSAFFNVQRWNELADTSMSPEEFMGLPCVVAVDLSVKIDFTARVLVFCKQIDKKDHYFVFTTFYLPEARALSPELQQYNAWAKAGFIRTMPGAEIDFVDFTQDTIQEITRFKAREFCFDPWHAQQMAQEIGKKTRCQPVKVEQFPRYLSEPMRQIEALMMGGRIHHDGNPVMAWMMSNVVVKEDVKGEIAPRKNRPADNIDGPSALTTGMVRAVHLSTFAGSVYATRGLLTL